MVYPTYLRVYIPTRVPYIPQSGIYPPWGLPVCITVDIHPACLPVCITVNIHPACLPVYLPFVGAGF